MDAYQERLSRLGELGDDEISALEQELISAFDAADGNGDVDTMSSIADALDTVRAETQRRASNPAPASAPAAEAPAAPAPAAAPAPVAASGADAAVLDAPVTEEVIEEVVAESDTADTTPPADDTTPVAEEVEAPVAEAPADTDTPPEEGTMADDIADLTASDVVEEAQPEVAAFEPLTVIRAGGDIPGHTAGSELESLDDVAEAMASRINSFARLTGGDGEQAIVASLAVTIEDEDRVLRRGDIEGNSAKIRKALEPEALTAAANGWCAPRAPIYNIFGLGETSRPVRDSLPSFQADRGGIVYSTPPKLSDAGFGAGMWTWYGAEWQAANSPASGAPTDDTKILFEATCPAELTADLEAYTSQVKFTNMMARAFPELVRRNMELALIAHARFAEARLLRAMWNASDVTMTANPSIPLGAARDVLFTFRNQAASYRNRHRMSPGATLDAWAPVWMRDVIAMDLTAQMPGDDKLSVGYAEIEGFLRDTGVNVNWFLDDVPGNGTSQMFASATASFPVNAAVILAAPGTFLHLDGGTLDLGVVRDATLVGTNQYIEFTETFEQVAKVGIEAQKMTVPMFVSGTTALGLATNAGITQT